MKSGMGYQRRLGITTNKDVGIKEKKENDPEEGVGLD
jgi:hypothetical protein